MAQSTQRNNLFIRRVASSSNAATPLCAVASAKGNARMTITGPRMSCATNINPSNTPAVRTAGVAPRRQAR